jgi:hypothetical protein
MGEIANSTVMISEVAHIRRLYDCEESETAGCESESVWNPPGRSAFCSFWNIPNTPKEAQCSRILDLSLEDFICFRHTCSYFTLFFFTIRRVIVYVISIFFFLLCAYSLIILIFPLPHSSM